MIDYDKFLNQSLCAVKPSGIRRFFAIAEEMENVISLGVGEPDFKTPWHIRQYGIDFLEQGKTRYTANAGLIELRNEISNYYARRFLIKYDPKSEILVTVGGSEGIDMAIRSMIEPGDEVLVVEPSFVCYKPIVETCAGKAVPLVTKEEDDFKLTPDALRAAVTDKTKILILPFPNNPTGAIMERDDLLKIADFAEAHDLIVISDEIYGDLTYGGVHECFSALPKMRDRTILLNGFSKAYAMTGWRIGYALSNPDFIGAMTKIHQYTILCAPITAQMAAVEALKRGEKYMKKMVADYDRRRRLIYDGFKTMGLESFEPRGAFYIFPNVAASGFTSEEFAEKLIQAEHVALVPGTAFGKCGAGHVRCSYATSIDKISEALNRIEHFLKNHK